MYKLLCVVFVHGWITFGLWQESIFCACLSSGNLVKLNERPLTMKASWTLTKSTVTSKSETFLLSYSWAQTKRPHQWAYQDACHDCARLSKERCHHWNCCRSKSNTNTELEYLSLYRLIDKRSLCFVHVPLFPPFLSLSVVRVQQGDSPWQDSGVPEGAHYPEWTACWHRQAGREVCQCSLPPSKPDHCSGERERFPPGPDHPVWDWCCRL